VALLNPAHRREEGIKWWLILYTMAMFLFVTMYTAINLHIQFVSFIDNRQDPSGASKPHSAPLLYQHIIHSTVLGLVPNILFNLNNWLADGLLVSSLFDPVLSRPGV